VDATRRPPKIDKATRGQEGVLDRGLRDRQQPVRDHGGDDELPGIAWREDTP